MGWGRMKGYSFRVTVRYELFKVTSGVIARKQLTYILFLSDIVDCFRSQILLMI